jgi:anti-sigma factor RsiW
MVMEHDDAIRTQAAERYLLGEMSFDEREVYEDHYFSCESCGNELSATVAFVDNARAALAQPFGAVTVDRDDKTRLRGRTSEDGWRRLLAAPQGLVPALSVAVVLLIAVVGYQRLAIIPDLREQLAERDSPQAVPTVALRSAARGSGARLLVNPTDTFAVLQADVLPENVVRSYTALLVAADGREQFRTSVTAPEIGMPVTLLVPVRELAPGAYTLIFLEHDAAGGEAGRFIFTLERQ